VPGVVDLSEFAIAADGVARIVLESVQELLLKLALQMARDDYETRRERQRQVCNLPRPPVNMRGVYPMPPPISASSRCAAQVSRSSVLPNWPGAAKAK